MIEDFSDSAALASHVAKLIEACEQYSDEQKPARDTALEYYNGEMRDLPAEEGRSQVVSKDSRAVIKKLMPSIMRTLLSNDKIVEYEPVEQEDEARAEQATDYINMVVVPECGAEQAIYDAVFDALVLKTGILKWTAYRRKHTRVKEWTDQPPDALVGLEGDPDIEILEQVEKPVTDPDVLALDPSAVCYDLTIRSVEERVETRLEAVPRGAFLILPGSDSIEESPLVGERQLVTRSELVSRGYDKDEVYSLAAYDSKDEQESDDISRQGEDWSDIEAQTSKAMEEVQLYEVYARLDLDKDGIAELYKICMAERGSDDVTKHAILSMEAVSEAPYAEVVAEREAHQFEGHSVAEDVNDIQRIKTALLRATLDNTYWQNNPQPVIDPAKLTEQGLEAVYRPGFGKPIALKGQQDVREAVNWLQVPFVGDKSFAMMDYLDRVLQDRTGITDQSGGLDPEAFQDMTATSAQIMAESGIAQADMIIRSLARGGLRKAFKGILRLVVSHADRPRTVRLRNEWVSFDPRGWNADMDCTVNVGLGAGSRERDLAVLQMVLGLQRELLTSLGPDNPFVKPDQLYNVLAKITEAAGFPSADPYFTQPDEQDIQRALAKGQGPTPEQMKAQLQAQVEKNKADARKEVEAAQMQADLRVKEAELRSEAALAEQKAENERVLARMKGELDLLKHRENLEFRYFQEGVKHGEQERHDATNLYGMGGV